VTSHPAPRALPAPRAPARGSTSAPVNPGRIWAPRSVTGTAARPVDGNAWCAKALGEIKTRVARGEKVQVVFDIDNTLSDGRARTLALGQQWDKANGTHYFHRVPVTRVGHDAVDTAATLKIPSPNAEAFKTFWDVAFWKGENFKLDTPIAEVVKLAKAAANAGANVIYVTGRIEDLESASVAQLKRFGLPNADAKHVVSKPSVDVKTAPWRTNWLATHAPQHTAFFFTESRRDVGSAQAAAPNLPCVLLQSPFGGDTPVDARTPIFRASH
jgi:hypothetical protein